MKNRITRQFHTDGKKRRSFLAMLFASGELRRYAEEYSMRLLLFVITIYIVSGCASNSLNTYDHNAIKKSGTINYKQEIENYEIYRSDTLLVPVAGVFVPVQLGSPMKDGNDFLYKVQINEGMTMPIISKFSGFEIGECVTVFLSKSLPPRIAHGGECE